jgi:hypothetical protein
LGGDFLIKQSVAFLLQVTLKDSLEYKDLLDQKLISLPMVAKVPPRWCWPNI